MGRAKIDTTQELEPESKKRSTFKQRGAGLKKKFDEMGTLCGVQGLLIAHGPQGELIDLCSNTSMHELFERFINSKYKHMLPLPDAHNIQVAITKRKEGHVQRSEKDQLDAEFADQLDHIPLEESMSPVTADEIETFSEEHIRLMEKALDANLEALRDFQEQLQITRTTSQIVEEDGIDHGLQTTHMPPGIDSTSMIQVSTADASMQETQGKLQADEKQDDGLEDEQVLQIQSTPDDNIESQLMNDIYTPMSAELDDLLVDNMLHIQLFEFDDANKQL